MILFTFGQATAIALIAGAVGFVFGIRCTLKMSKYLDRKEL